MATVSRDYSKIGVWRGSYEEGNSGLEVRQGSLALTVFEVPAIPDLSSPKFADLSQLDKARRIAEMSRKFEQLLGALHSLGYFSGFSLRFCYEPDAAGGSVRAFLIGRAFGSDQQAAFAGLDNFREAVRRSFPSEYPLVEVPPPVPGTKEAAEIERIIKLEGIRSIAEILKPEQVLPAWHAPEFCGFTSYYMTRSFESNAANDMTDLCRALMASSGQGPVVIDMCFVPAFPLTEIEKDNLSQWQNTCEIWGRSRTEEFGGGLYSKPQRVEFAPDPNANEAKQSYAELHKRYGNASRCFLYSLRAMWWNDSPPAQIAAALASQALAPGSQPQTIVIYRDDPAFQRALNAAASCYVTPAVCNAGIWSRADAPETLRRLHRLVDMKEATGFFRLPIAGRDGCPGMRLDTGFESRASSGAKPLVIGKVVENQRTSERQFSLVPKELTKHALIVGTPGSGKTTLCFSILTQLWRDFKIPFIVLEPAKTEYRGLRELREFRDDLLVFTVGNENFSPFRFNPFEVPHGINLGEHMSTLNACFAGAFNLFDPLPMIFDEAIREIYRDAGWLESDNGGDDPALQAPTLEEFQRSALKIAQGKSYAGEVAGNIKGAIETRLGSLTRGLKGRCFNTRQSIPFDLLMSKPVIFELDALNSEEKALFMMFVLTTVRATAKIRQRERAGNLAHVVLVEEAHNVIGRQTGQANSGTANPAELSVRLFTNMLAEMRAWGQGIIIADQLPTAIAPEAIKNTNLKVMHRVVAADDRQELGNSMVFDPGQFQQAAILPAGYSYVFKEGEARSQMVLEPNVKEDWERSRIDVERPDDAAISESMRLFRSSDKLRPIYLPYPTCSDVCESCDVRTRERTEHLVKSTVTRIRHDGGDWSGAPVGNQLMSLLERPEILENQTRLGCTYVHILQDGEAAK